MIMEEQKN